MRSDTIVTAAEMRQAEQRAIVAGTPVETLMDRAGAGAAEAILRYGGGVPTLVLCGPGNNGGDGYVIARILKDHGVDVRVTACGEPRSKTASQARQRWDGSIEPLDEATPAPLLVDALFGTGLTRPLDDAVAEQLRGLAQAAAIKVAVDLPSGVSADDGRLLSFVPDYDLTVTFAAPKPAHFLQPAARHVGRLVVADIGVEALGKLRLVTRPRLRAPGPDDHKYSRGYVAVVAGEMPGAASLCAAAAARAGAGYVRLFADRRAEDIPHAIVQGGEADMSDPRIGSLAFGPGLGRGSAARARLEGVLAGSAPLVLDADALWLLGEADWPLLSLPILTPHAGEFERLFGAPKGSKADQALAAASRSGAVIVYKGPDTVVAAPDGRAAVTRPAPSWLASAGTGDVLTGIIAAMRARGLDPFEAACAGVWLHGRAAELAGPGLIADDLLLHLRQAIGECA